MAAWGAAHTIEVEGDGRFLAASRACSELSEQTQVLGVPDDFPALPLVVGGFAFSSSAAAAWDGWPACSLWVPEMLVVRTGGRVLAVVAGDTSAASSPGAVSEVLGRLNNRLAIVRDRWVRPRAAPAATAAPRTAVGAAPDRAWTDLVERARQAVSDEDLDKVVVARSHHFAGQGRVEPLATAWAMRDAHRGAIGFCVGLGSEAFVGATPELLAHVSGGVVRTTALAGTTRRGRSPEEDEALACALLASAKDRLEQQHVVQGVVSSLADLDASVSAVDEPVVRRLRHVQHLETPIQATLTRPCHVLDVVARLHPTPAVGGWPNDLANAWLAANEPLARGWYAGPVGWVDADGGGTFAVAIRSARLTPDRAEAFAGAGIVAASDPEAEWRETAIKLETVASSLHVRPITEPS